VQTLLSFAFLLANQIGSTILVWRLGHGTLTAGLCPTLWNPDRIRNRFCFLKETTTRCPIKRQVHLSTSWTHVIGAEVEELHLPGSRIAFSAIH